MNIYSWLSLIFGGLNCKPRTQAHLLQHIRGLALGAASSWRVPGSEFVREALNGTVFMVGTALAAKCSITRNYRGSACQWRFSIVLVSSLGLAQCLSCLSHGLPAKSRFLFLLKVVVAEPLSS